MNDERKRLIEAFEKAFGPQGHHLPEDLWLECLGLFVTGWQEAMAYYRARAAEVGSNIFVSECQGVPESPDETEHA